MGEGWGGPLEEGGGPWEKLEGGIGGELLGMLREAGGVGRMPLERAREAAMACALCTDSAIEGSVGSGWLRAPEGLGVLILKPQTNP